MTFSKPSFAVVSLIAFAVWLAAPPAASAQTRLYLKDGTYQLVKSYEIQGERVHYYSLERSEWEDIPVSLVDFEATRRAADLEKLEQKKQVDEAKALQKERFDKPEATGIEVAPGVRLPWEEGAYAYDGLRVIRLMSTPGEVVRDKKRAALNLALPLPVLKNRQLVELVGAKAAVRIANPRPVFYMHAGDEAGSSVQLMTLRPVKEHRIVEKVDTGQILPGRPNEVHDTIELERVKLAPGLYKLTPTAPLTPGEYALGAMAHQLLNLDVWDFGIDAGGAAPLTPVEGPPSTTMNEKPPGVSTTPNLPRRSPTVGQQIPQDSPAPPGPPQSPAQTPGGPPQP